MLFFWGPPFEVKKIEEELKSCRYVETDADKKAANTDAVIQEVLKAVPVSLPLCWLRFLSVYVSTYLHDFISSSIFFSSKWVHQKDNNSS